MDGQGNFLSRRGWMDIGNFFKGIGVDGHGNFFLSGWGWIDKITFFKRMGLGRQGNFLREWGCMDRVIF